MATDSAAAHRRRLRSSNTGDTAAYLATIVASSSTLRCIEPSRPQIAEDGKLIYVSVLSGPSASDSTSHQQHLARPRGGIYWSARQRRFRLYDDAGLLATATC